MQDDKFTIDNLLPKRNEVFERRLKIFSSIYSPLLGLNLAIVAEGHDFINALAEKHGGKEEVGIRKPGEFKDWDPKTLAIDKKTEDIYIQRMQESGKHIIVLSEELEEAKTLNEASGQLRYAVCDPFDGSFLFYHDILAMWFSSLAFYSADGKPLSDVVCDPINNIFNFADKTKAYTTILRGDELSGVRVLNKDYRRELRGREEAVDIDPNDGSIESYALKPKRFGKPLRAQYGDILDGFKFFYPNGGPDGFGDVATGKIDVYFAPRQPHVDVFSGMPLAMNSGCQVANFDGSQVRFTSNVKTLHDIVVTSTPQLMKKMLTAIEECGGNPNIEIWGR